MDDLELLLDLHLDGARQGPGSNAATQLALSFSGLEKQSGLHIADIGCGTGASARLLASVLDARITAVDFLEPFLNVLEREAEKSGVADRIDTLACSMDDLPFAPESLDAIWSEGAIYNIGFENGIAAWRHFLKPGGVLAVSELTWLTQTRPAALTDHWMAEYPQVATAGEKIRQLEMHGYRLLGYFPLAKACWLDEYYRPIEARIDGFLKRHNSSAAAQAIVDAEKREIRLYEEYADFVSYGFYIAQKA